MSSVRNIRIDITNYFPHHWVWLTNDYQIITNYINVRQYSVSVVSLNQKDSRDIGPSLQLLSCEIDENQKFTGKTQLISYPLGKESLLVNSDFDIFEYQTTIDSLRLTKYNLISTLNYEPVMLSREQFNIVFKANVTGLPTGLYAIGLKDSVYYSYNEYCSINYSLSIPFIRHILSIALTFFKERCNNMYFIICVHDGYLEEHYPSKRNNPIVMTNEDTMNKILRVKNSSDYPILYDKKYILGQSHHNNVDYTLDIPDRHYFLCNMYNSFRSYHRGIPFKSKINKIVYAGRVPMGSYYNFTKRRDIQTCQREYFYTNAVDKKNIYGEKGMNINDTEMVNYKYILNIDGISSCWDATAWKMNSGSVVFKTDSDWKQWFYDDYKPWVHFVPIADDFSDINEKYEWAESHQDECEKIVKNSLELFQKTYRFHNIIEHTKSVVKTLLDA